MLTLHGFDTSRFLAEHWQQQPVLLRGALRDWQNPLEPNVLAGLALEHDIESRLVLHDRATDHYSLEHGPFAADRFQQLPAQDWTLLVQAVDQWIPEVAALIEPFRALVPDWRIDDVMVSYAPPGGGVGPHYDHYDVFLVQGLGQRRWRIGLPVSADTPLRPDSALRLLQNFPVTADYLLQPGDILYVPPGWGHWGEADSEDCMTYSVGMRAPDQGELIAYWADHVLSRCTPFGRYTDPALPSRHGSAWLDDAAIEQARQLMLQQLTDADAFGEWLGSWLSEPKYPELLSPPDTPITNAALASQLAAGAHLFRNPGTRMLLRRRGHGTELCVDGKCQRLDAASLAIAERLCALPRHARLTLETAPCASTLKLLTSLLNQGSLWLESNMEEHGRH